MHDGMAEKNMIDKIQSELQEGMSLAKCKKCGCMKEALEALHSSLPSLQTEGSLDLLKNVESWIAQMEQIKYACLGCEHCFGAVAMNIFNETFQEAPKTQLSCAFEVREQTWPPVPGEYFAFCEGRTCPVAVSTLASVELAKALADTRPKELCIVGKTETENIGIDKIIKNTITNPTIRYLLVAGKDPNGHYSGKTLLALWENGVDEHMIGCEDVEKIVEKLRELSLESSTCSCEECAENIKPVQISTVPVIQAKEPAKVEMDRAGYFVIIPQSEEGIVIVEHYSNDNRLLRIIEGKDARSIYWTVVENCWITELSHAAYLGKELAKAELSIKTGFKYVQDGA